MLMYVGHISQGQSYMILSREWAIIGHYGVDCIDFAKRCDACQLHANFIHKPSEPLHPTVAS